jgi:hypothetical protein
MGKIRYKKLCTKGLRFDGFFALSLQAIGNGFPTSSQGIASWK